MPLTAVRVLASLVAALLLLLLQGEGAHAATISVTTTTDELEVDGDCSLREAIQAANADTTVDACAAGSGADIIVVPAGTYTLTTELVIGSDLTISGAGAASTIIQACDSSGGPCTGTHRLFQVRSATVSIDGVTVRNGFADIGGGIFNHLGTLSLTNSIVSGNSASNAGGGISDSGGITSLTGSTVSGNSAFSGGGIWHLYALPQLSLTVTGSTVSGNTATADGGGIYNLNSVASLINSTVSDNSATGEGGGIFDAGLSLAVTDSTVSGNSAFSGGGILTRTLTLTNSTVSGNSVSNTGGGIGNRGTVTLTNSTVSGNSAGNGGGVANFTGGVATLRNTIIANSSSGGNCSDTITSQGHNLSSDGSCASSFTDPSDLNSTDPMLGPLANNGGPTHTHALLAGSPAIDAGSSDCPPPATDQRGVPRPQGSACDIGAFELEAVTSTPTPTPTPIPTIAVHASDGHGNDLLEVKVRITEILSDGSLLHYDSVRTDLTGRAVVSVQDTSRISTSTFRVRVLLDGLAFAVHYKTAETSPVGLVTSPFSFGAGEVEKIVEVNFGAPGDSIPTPADLTSRMDLLDDLAHGYFRSQQATGFHSSALGHAFSNHIPVIYYTKGECGARLSLTLPPTLTPVDIKVSTDMSNFDHPNAPINREWHELSHFLEAEALSPEFFIALGKYHDGYYKNPSTEYSLIEGLAEFVAAAISGQPQYPMFICWEGGNQLLRFFCSIGFISLETDLKVWDCNRLGEEFAVAGILWDLYDGSSGGPTDNDADGAGIPIQTIWDVITSESPDNLHDVYTAFKSRAGELGLSTSAWDQIFINHGAFADLNCNKQFDQGETIGRAADCKRPDRV